MRCVDIMVVKTDEDVNEVERWDAHMHHWQVVWVKWGGTDLQEL